MFRPSCQLADIKMENVNLSQRSFEVHLFYVRKETSSSTNLPANSTKGFIMSALFGANRPMVFGKTPPSRSSTSTVYQYSPQSQQQDVFISQPRFGVIQKRTTRKYAEGSIEREKIHAQNKKAKEKMDKQFAFLRKRTVCTPEVIQEVRNRESTQDKQNRAERDFLYGKLSQADQIEYNRRFKLENEIKKEEIEQASSQQIKQENFFHPTNVESFNPNKPYQLHLNQHAHFHNPFQQNQPPTQPQLSNSELLKELSCWMDLSLLDGP
jgi:hypothetical protein